MMTATSALMFDLRHNIAAEGAYNGIHDQFYVSFNFADKAWYGCGTTALVWNQVHFFILNGNHLEQYERLIPMGFWACMDYFLQHLEQKNYRCEPLPKPIGPDEFIQSGGLSNPHLMRRETDDGWKFFRTEGWMGWVCPDCCVYTCDSTCGCGRKRGA